MNRRRRPFGRLPEHVNCSASAPLDATWSTTGCRATILLLLPFTQTNWPLMSRPARTPVRCTLTRASQSLVGFHSRELDPFLARHGRMRFLPAFTFLFLL